jgi:hypothetical protein
MAFDANKKKLEGAAGASFDNPYSSLLNEGDGQPATSSAPLAGTGATPTGYVNFGDFYDANAAAAQAGAQQLQTSAGQKGQQAQAGLTGAQQQFNKGVQAGTPTGPSTNDFWRASGYTNQGVATGDGKNPGANPGVAYGHGQQPASPSARNPNGPPDGWAKTNNGGSDADNARWAQGAQNALNGYTGPNALSESQGYGDLLKNTTSAADEANALASGNNGIAGALQGSANTSADAALLGAAGRQGFADVGRKYGGLGSALDAANARSQQQSAQAKQDSANALEQYEQLAQQEDATNAANKPAPVTLDAAPGVGGSDATLGPGSASDDPSTWGTAQWIRNIGGWMSPLDDLFHVTGNKGPIDYSTDYFENQFGPIGGQSSSQDQTLNPNKKDGS